MRNYIKSYWAMLMLAALAVDWTIRHPDYWAGFMMATTLCFFGFQISAWLSDRWLAKRGYRRGHVRISKEDSNATQ